MEIENNEEYLIAMDNVAKYFEDEPELGTPEGDEFEALVLSIVAYEEIHFPFSTAIKKEP